MTGTSLLHALKVKDTGQRRALDANNNTSTIRCRIFFGRRLWLSWMPPVVWIWTCGERWLTWSWKGFLLGWCGCCRDPPASSRGRKKIGRKAGKSGSAGWFEEGLVSRGTAGCSDRGSGCSSRGPCSLWVRLRDEGEKEDVKETAVEKRDWQDSYSERVGPLSGFLSRRQHRGAAVQLSKILPFVLVLMTCFLSVLINLING